MVSLACLYPRDRGGRPARCGNCAGCRAYALRDTTDRLQWEVAGATAAWFFTGTFADEVPDRKAAQRGWKAFTTRLDRRFPGVTWRYKRVSEFGPKLGRFHWHALFICRADPGVKVPRVKDLRAAWINGEAGEGFPTVNVLKGPKKPPSFYAVRKSVGYIAKYLGKPPKLPAAELAKLKAVRPNTSGSPHLGEVGISHVVSDNPVLAAASAAFPGAKVTGMYVRTEPDSFRPVSLEDAAAGVPSVRRRIIGVPWRMPAGQEAPYRRLKPGEFASGIDPDDLAEAEQARRDWVLDAPEFPQSRADARRYKRPAPRRPEDDPNRVVMGPGGSALTVGQSVQSTVHGDLAKARSARIAATHKSWFSADLATAAKRQAEAFKQSRLQDPGLDHVASGDDDEESNHWFGD